MEDLLEAVRFLAAPYDDVSADARFGEVKSADSTSSLWLKVCEQVWEKVPLSGEGEVLIRTRGSSSTWKLVCTILETLLNLKEEMEKIEKTQNEEEIKIELLSVQSQACVSTCIELIIGFGVLPYMLPGIGIPNEFRKISAQVESALKEERTLPPVIQFNHLAHVLRSLMTLCVHPKFANLIISKHLTDVFLGLMQTMQCPIKKPEIGTASGTPNALTMDEYKKVMITRKKVDFQYQISFLNIVPKAMLVHSLFIGGGQRSKWMAQSCNDLLHDILLGKGGLKIVCHALLEMMDSSKNWEVGKVVNNLVFNACKTENASKTTERFSNLCAQCYEVIIYSLIEKEKSKRSPSATKSDAAKSWLHVSLFCVTALTNININLVQPMLWNPLFGRMNRIFSSNEYASATQIEQCADIAQAILGLSPPAEIKLPILMFKPTWYMFLQVLVACENFINKNQFNLSQDHITVSIRDKLIHVFSSLLEIISANSKDDVICNTDNHTTVSEFCRDLILSLVQYDLKTVVVQEGSSSATSSSSSTVNLRFTCVQNHPKHSHEILSQGCSIFTKAVLMTEHLMEIRSRMFCQLLISNVNVKSGGVMETQLEFAKLVVLTLMDNIAAQDENVLENFAKNNEENNSFKILEVIAMKLINEVESSIRNCDDYEFHHSLTYFLGMLSTLCENGISMNAKCSDPKTTGNSMYAQNPADSSELWLALDKFIPYLKKLCYRGGRVNPKETIMTANRIICCIECRGVNFHWNLKSPNEKEKASRYENALRDVKNLQPAIKGHGLLELRKLIEEEDKETLENDQFVLSLFKTELKNDDSYVYLMAINGMASLGSRFHGIVMPALIGLYDFQEGPSNTSDSKFLIPMSTEERVEFRLKIGEIIVKVIKNLGVDLAPLYRVPMTNVCFRLLRDEDESVRASALANLGELCQVLKLGLGNILTEVWSCVENLLNSEQSCQVRRAALHLMVLLLRSVAMELSAEFLVVNKDVGVYIRDARRLLTKLRATENDPVSLTHVELAMAEIAFIAAKFFMLPGQDSSQKS